MDLKKGLLLLVQDHLDEQERDPQMLRLSEITALLDGNSAGGVHDEILPEYVVRLIMTRLKELGVLEQAESCLQKLEENTILEETSLYGIMADLGILDWE